jgi:hypothetical protein
VKYPKYTQKQLEDIMSNAIKKYTIPAYLEDLNDVWWNDAKLSDEWLDKIFPEFYKQLGLDKNTFNFKKNYYQLINLMDIKDIPLEITEKLDAIYKILK